MTSKKRPLKHFEHSIGLFNDDLIPDRLFLMKMHRLNIETAIRSQDYQTAISGQAAVKTLVQKLKTFSSDIKSLRNQVDIHDLVQFGKAIENSQKDVLTELEAYIDLGHKLSPSKKSKMADKQTKDKEEFARSWELLQNDIKGLHSIYADLHKLTEGQGELIIGIEDNKANTTESVHQGNLNLKRETNYAFVGAAIGALVGGPVILLFGWKAVAGCLLGFVGGWLLKKTRSPFKK